MTVAEAQARIDAREFSEWKAFYRIEPWGERRADYRAALLMSAILAKGGGSATPEDCMPKLGNVLYYLSAFDAPATEDSIKSEVQRMLGWMRSAG